MPAYSRHVGQGKQKLHPPIPSFPSLPPNSALTQAWPSHFVYCVETVIAILCTALKFLSPDADPPVPWQRVVSSAGKISSRGPGTDGAQRQRDALEAEDVEVRVGRADELLIDLVEYGWFPVPGTMGL